MQLHDTGDRFTLGTTSLDPFQKYVDIVKQLRDDEIGTGVAFCLKPFKILLL